MYDMLISGAAGGPQMGKMPPPLPFSQKKKGGNELNYCLSRKLYILMTPYHTNRC